MPQLVLTADVAVQLRLPEVVQVGLAVVIVAKVVCDGVTKVTVVLLPTSVEVRVAVGHTTPPMKPVLQEVMVSVVTSVVTGTTIVVNERLLEEDVAGVDAAGLDAA